MSFLKRLFGSGSKPPMPTEAADEPQAYAGYEITPAPMAEGGQFRLCAIITKTIGGQERSHRMIRADLFPGRDEAAEAAARKARQMIDEQGEAIFST